MSEGNGRLNTWKEIASYFGKSISWVQRRAKYDGLPVHKYPGGSRYAIVKELELWENTKSRT